MTGVTWIAKLSQRNSSLIVIHTFSWCLVVFCWIASVLSVKTFKITESPAHVADNDTTERRCRKHKGCVISAHTLGSDCIHHTQNAVRILNRSETVWKHCLWPMWVWASFICTSLWNTLPLFGNPRSVSDMFCLFEIKYYTKCGLKNDCGLIRVTVCDLPSEEISSNYWRQNIPKQRLHKNFLHQESPLRTQQPIFLILTPLCSNKNKACEDLI